MKRITALFLAALMLAAALASCADAGSSTASRVRVTSSDAADAAAWLEARLGERLTESVVLGTDASGYDVDVSSLEAKGYVIRAIGEEIALFAATPDGLDRAVRKYAKMVEAGAVTDVTYNDGYRVKKLTIAGNDITEYAIVIVTESDDYLTYTANELARFIQETCGAVLPVFAASEYKAADEKPARQIVLTSGDEALGDEGFQILVGEDGTLTINGGLWRGTIFGVYDLLEDIGWRFLGDGTGCFSRVSFMPNDKRTYLYEAEHIDLSAAINRTEKPSIPVRGFPFYGDGNGFREQKSSYCRQIGFAPYAVHGLANYHEEIFSGEYDGLYLGIQETGKQPCFTNEEILEAIEAFALRYTKEQLDAGKEIGVDLCAVDVAQWDGGPSSFCQCKSCVAVERVEGNHCGPYLRMANRVADALDKSYPGMCASILAYNGTDELPKITRPAKNLYVAYCFYLGQGYAGCQNHSINGVDCGAESGMTNKVPAKRFEEWAAVMDGSMIQIWLYPSNCYNICYNSPQYLTLLDNVRYLASYGVGHILHDTRWQNNGLINEELSCYLLHKFEWDASITDEEALELMREWFILVYGDAGEMLCELALFAERAGDVAGCWGSFNGSSKDRVNYDFVSRNAEQIWTLCDSARKMAASAGEEAMIDKCVTGFLFMTLRARYDDMYKNGSVNEREYITARYREVWELFTKYRLATYTTLNYQYYAPETFDPDVDPRDWIDNSINVTEE